MVVFRKLLERITSNARSYIFSILPEGGSAPPLGFFGKDMLGQIWQTHKTWEELGVVDKSPAFVGSFHFLNSILIAWGVKLSLATSIAESSGGTQVFGLGGSVMRPATQRLCRWCACQSYTKSSWDIEHVFLFWFKIDGFQNFKIIIEDHPESMVLKSCCCDSFFVLAPLLHSVGWYWNQGALFAVHRRGAPTCLLTAHLLQGVRTE